MTKTVLVVEDYADTRTMMKFLLQRFGFEVIEAADGQEALDYLQGKEKYEDREAFPFPDVLVTSSRSGAGMQELRAAMVRQSYSEPPSTPSKTSVASERPSPAGRTAWSPMLRSPTEVASQRNDRGGSCWVTVHLDCEADVDLLLSLVSIALKAHQSPPADDGDHGDDPHGSALRRA